MVRCPTQPADPLNQWPASRREASWPGASSSAWPEPSLLAGLVSEAELKELQSCPSNPGQHASSVSLQVLALLRYAREPYLLVPTCTDHLAPNRLLDC